MVALQEVQEEARVDGHHPCQRLLVQLKEPTFIIRT
jgi:hypothetical protein